MGRMKLVVYYDPYDVMDPDGCTEQEIKEYCFRVRHYDSYATALESYANTRCTWSRLLEDDKDEQKFIDEAWGHILDHDYDWLEQNFV